MRIEGRYEYNVYEIRKLNCGEEVSFERTKVIILKEWKFMVMEIRSDGEEMRF